MDNSISFLIGQVNKLLDNVVTFRGRLEHHAIKEPQAQLYDALRNGFPEDIYMHYLNNYLKVNENAVEDILKDIDNVFIPYLKDVAFHLQEAVNVGPGTTSSGIPNSSANSSANKIRQAIEENNKDLEKSLGIKCGSKMSIAEADKQNANPNYKANQVEYLPDKKGKYAKVWNESKSREEYINKEEWVKRGGDVLSFEKEIRYNKNPYWQYSVNCATTSTAYALRLRGFNLWAKGNPETEGNLNTWLSDHHSFDIWNNVDGTEACPTLYGDWMKKKGLNEMSTKDYMDFFEEECKDKGVYIVTTYWKRGGGHATILQRDVDGKLYYIEPQVFKADKADEIGRMNVYDLANRMSPDQRWNGVMRVDDKIFNVKYADLFEK